MRPEDKSELSKLVSTIKEGYSEKYEEAKRHWGGGIMGQKAIARTEKKRKAMEVRFYFLSLLITDHIIIPKCPIWTMGNDAK